MPTKLTKHITTTPQTEQAPGQKQIKNAAGGYVFESDPWTILDRFLVLGTDGGSYYVSERKMTVDHATNIINLIRQDVFPSKVVARVRDFRDKNRAPKIDPLLFTLALVIKHGDSVIVGEAYDAATSICWTATQLMTFVSYVRDLKGWSRGLRRCVANWYNNREPEQACFQIAKYGNRAGYTHRDLLRLAHPRPRTEEHDKLFQAVVKRDEELTLTESFLRYLRIRRDLAGETNRKKVLKLVRDERPPWEFVPTVWLKDREIALALLEQMPVMATIRQLGRLSAIGLFEPLSRPVDIVRERLSEESVRKSRIHPMHLLAAHCIYGQGHGERGHLSWTRNQSIMDALDGAFYHAFPNVERTGKRVYVALDVSGSMDFNKIAGIPGMTPRTAATALALIFMRVERNCYLAAFSTYMQEVKFGPLDTLQSAIRAVSNLSFGGTDAALPILDALKRRLDVDAFLILTDGDTWAGRTHAFQALEKYRSSVNPKAKLIQVSMVANSNRLGLPDDPGVLEVVGFDTATPELVNAFLMM